MVVAKNVSSLNKDCQATTRYPRRAAHVSNSSQISVRSHVIRGRIESCLWLVALLGRLAGGPQLKEFFSPVFRNLTALTIFDVRARGWRLLF